jgi:MFS family permease
MLRSNSQDGLSLNPEVRRAGVRRSLRVVTLSWVFGSVWATAVSGAPLTLFAHGLKASEFQFGVLSALPFIASLIALPASVVTERTGARKRIFFIGSYLNRILWVPIALLPMWMIHAFGMESATNAMSAFLILLFFMHAGGNAGGPAWTSWMADIVPERSRGKYFSRRRCYGILSAIPAALAVGWLLDRAAVSGGGNVLLVMKWCAIVFMAASVFGMTDIFLFNFVPDVPKAPQRDTSLLTIFAKPMRDPQFLWFAGFVATLVFAVSFMGQFVTLFMIDKLKITNTQTQMMLLVAPMLAQLIVLPVWGAAADRMGKKPVLAIASLGLVPVGLGWCLVSPQQIWLGYVLSALGAALWAGVEVANLNLVLEMAGSSTDDGQKGGSNYVAVNSVIVNVAGCLGGLSSGVIAQLLRNWHWDPNILGLHTITFYEVLFILSGVLRLVAAVAFLPHIHEPKAKATYETLRFMTSNIYNNMFSAIFQPLRYAGLKARDSYIPRKPVVSALNAKTLKLPPTDVPGPRRDKAAA